MIDAMSRSALRACVACWVLFPLGDGALAREHEFESIAASGRYVNAAVIRLEPLQPLLQQASSTAPKLRNLAQIHTVSGGRAAGCCSSSPILDPGESHAIEGTVAAGETDQAGVLIRGAEQLVIKASLGGSVRGACEVRLTFLHPDGTSAGSVLLTPQSQTLTVPAVDGFWTFMTTASAGCGSQTYSIEISASGSLVGTEAASLWASLLVLLCAGLVGHRLRRGRPAAAAGRIADSSV